MFFCEDNWFSAFIHIYVSDLWSHKDGKFVKLYSIDTNGKNCEQPTNIPRNGSKTLMFPQGDSANMLREFHPTLDECDSTAEQHTISFLSFLT